MASPPASRAGGTTLRLSRSGLVLSLRAYAGMGMTPLDFAARYRDYAAKCFLLGQNVRSAAERLALLDMAQAWMDLAEQAAKNESLAIINEAPVSAEQTRSEDRR